MKSPNTFLTHSQHLMHFLFIVKFRLLSDLELVSYPPIPWTGSPTVQQPGQRGSTEPTLWCQLAPCSSGEMSPGDSTAWAEGRWGCSPWSWTNSQSCRRANARQMPEPGATVPTLPITASLFHLCSFPSWSHCSNLFVWVHASQIPRSLFPELTH